MSPSTQTSDLVPMGHGLRHRQEDVEMVLKVTTQNIAVD